MDARYRSIRRKYGSTELYKRLLIIIHILFGLSFILNVRQWHCLCVYFTISEVFMWNPLLLHKKMVKKHEYSDKPYGFYLGAHRGGSREGVENTIENFKRGRDAGATCLEMDVCMTKDKQVVVVHDASLSRICGINKMVHELNYDEIPQICDQFPLHFSDQICDTTKEKDRRIPLFDDVCRELQNNFINMEIKHPDLAIGVECQKIIAKYKMRRKVVWGFFRHPLMMELVKIDPSIARFATDLEMLIGYISYFFGLLPFVTLTCDQFGIPICNNGFRDLLNVIQVQPVKKKFIIFLVSTLNLLCGPMYLHLRKRGIEPTVWVQNEEFDLEYALSYEGVCGIMTDLPSKFVEYSKTEIQ